MGHKDSNCGISEDLQSAQHNQNRCLRLPTLLGVEAKAIPVTSYIKTLGFSAITTWLFGMMNHRKRLRLVHEFISPPQSQSTFLAIFGKIRNV